MGNELMKLNVLISLLHLFSAESGATSRKQNQHLGCFLRFLLWPGSVTCKDEEPLAYNMYICDIAWLPLNCSCRFSRWLPRLDAEMGSCCFMHSLSSVGDVFNFPAQAHGLDLSQGMFFFFKFICGRTVLIYIYIYIF